MTRFCENESTGLCQQCVDELDKMSKWKSTDKK